MVVFVLQRHCWNGVNHSFVRVGQIYKCCTDVFSPVSVDGAAAREDDGVGGSLRRWKDHLCQPPEEAV